MKKMYEDGYSPSIIAEKFGVSRQYVRQCVVSFGCRPNCQTKKITACSLRKDEIFRDFFDGASINELSEKYSISEGYLNRLLHFSPETKKRYEERKKSKTLRGPKRKTEKRVALDERNCKIQCLRKEGKTVAELAKMFKTCESNIYRICSKSNDKVLENSNELCSQEGVE